MRAAVLHDFGDVRVEEVDRPTCGADEVVIAVSRVQLSVTECMLLAGERVALHDHLAARLADGPVAFGGHEFVGTVAAVGERVDAVAVGDRVTAVETLPCGTCEGCVRGVACAAPEYIGFTRTGALADQLRVPAAVVVPVPDPVTDRQACAVQPLVGALHAHDVAGCRTGESVLVIGAGVMGLHAVQLARHGNAGTVLASSRSAAKRELALGVGADHALDARGDVAAQVSELTGGRGVDVVIETAGGAPTAGLAGVDTLELATRVAARGGRIVVVSVLPDEALVPLGRLRTHGITLLHPGQGSDARMSGRAWFDHALGLVARGLVDVDVTVTHELDGLDRVGDAVAITMDKAAHGALGPAQLVLRGPAGA